MALEVIDNDLQDTKISSIRQSKCPSLSGRSELTYSIGKKKTKDILIRVDENSGAGEFSNAWISLKSILELINNNEPFSWSVLLPLFQHQSVNTAGFIVAALLQEGIVETVDKGSYRSTDKSIKTARRKAV